MKGNENNFATYSECLNKCHSSEEDLKSENSLDKSDEKETDETNDVSFKYPVWIPFPISSNSSPDSVCNLVMDPGKNT